MELSIKQKTLVYYLCKRLGFNEGQELDEYIEKLTKSAYFLRPKGKNETSWEYNGETYSKKYDIIDFLSDEFKLKKDKPYEIKLKSPNHFTASELSNFTFCPVGFSIGNSFDIAPITSSKIGTKLHQECRLINRYTFNYAEYSNEEDFETDIGWADNSHVFYQLDGKQSWDYFKEIIRSKLIFCGHIKVDEPPKLFKNEKLNFIGQPDYVFENLKGEVFIVEEKFKLDNNPESDTFYKNHKVQLASYIYFLNELKASYGYLVYWYYSILSDEISNYRCIIYKIERTGHSEELLNAAYEGVKKFKEKGFYNIETGIINLKKCASCVYCMYCGHKNGRKKQVSLPYQRSYHCIFPADYPEMLKKKDGENKI